MRLALVILLGIVSGTILVGLTFLGLSASVQRLVSFLTGIGIMLCWMVLQKLDIAYYLGLTHQYNCKQCGAPIDEERHNDGWRWKCDFCGDGAMCIHRPRIQKRQHRVVMFVRKLWWKVKSQTTKFFSDLIQSKIADLQAERAILLEQLETEWLIGSLYHETVKLALAINELKIEILKALIGT